MNTGVVVWGTAVGVLLFARQTFAAPEDHERLLQLQRRIDDLVAASAASSTRSHVVSVILLFGLVVEIVGALFLAGPALVAKQEDVMSLQAKSGWKDLAMHDKDGDGRVNFLGALGAVFLALGFVIQFGGTLLTLGIATWWSVVAILVAFSVAGSTFYFLLGQSPEQTRAQKLSVLWRNTRRLITPHWGCRCDCCNRRVDEETGEVRWRETPPAPQYPYLYAPRAWHVGHSNCLDGSGWYKPIVGIDGKEEDSIKRASFSRFWSQRTDRDKWWDGWSKNASSLPSARGRKEMTCPSEHEYRAVEVKVKRALRVGRDIGNLSRA